MPLNARQQQSEQGNDAAIPPLEDTLFAGVMGLDRNLDLAEGQ
jgi:hypothetical protein